MAEPDDEVVEGGGGHRAGPAQVADRVVALQGRLHPFPTDDLGQLADRTARLGTLVAAEGDVQSVTQVAGRVVGPGHQHPADGFEEPAAEAGTGHQRDPGVDLEVVETAEPGGEIVVGQGTEIAGRPRGQDRRLSAVDLGDDAAGQAQRARRHLEPGDRFGQPGLGRRFRRAVGRVSLQPEELLVHGLPGAARRRLPQPGQLVGVEVHEAVEGLHVGIGGVGGGEHAELLEVEAADAGLLVGQHEVLAERRERPRVPVGGVGPGDGDRVVGPVVEPVVPVDE